MIIQKQGSDKQVVFDNRNFVLESFELSSIEGEHVTNKTLNQHGAGITSTTLGTREGTIVGYILSGGESDMKVKRNLLTSTINPLFYVDIKKSGKVISGKPTSTPEFSTDYKNSNAHIQKFALNILCEVPFWNNINTSIDVLATWLPSASFPLVLTTEPPVIFGYRTQSLIVNVENKGAIDTGMIIEFKASGAVTNPSILNVETREGIKVNENMAAGDVLRINTGFGKKSIKKITSNIESNCFGKLDDNENVFLQLHPGSNLLRYDADTGLEQLEVVLHRKTYYIDEVER